MRRKKKVFSVDFRTYSENLVKCQLPQDLLKLLLSRLRHRIQIRCCGGTTCIFFSNCTVCTVFTFSFTNVKRKFEGSNFGCFCSRQCLPCSKWFKVLFGLQHTNYRDSERVLRTATRNRMLLKAAHLRSIAHSSVWADSCLTQPSTYSQLFSILTAAALISTVNSDTAVSGQSTEAR